RDLTTALPGAGVDARDWTGAARRVPTSVVPSPPSVFMPTARSAFMLRIAVPNKGTLSGAAAQMLREAGYLQRADDRDLVCRDVDNEVEFFYLRPRDIATYVGSGDLQLGITGRDLLVDAGEPAEELLDLGFGLATFRFAARPETVPDLAALSGRR